MQPRQSEPRQARPSLSPPKWRESPPRVPEIACRHARVPRPRDGAGGGVQLLRRLVGARHAALRDARRRARLPQRRPGRGVPQDPRRGSAIALQEQRRVRRSAGRSARQGSRAAALRGGRGLRRAFLRSDRVVELAQPQHARPVPAEDRAPDGHVQRRHHRKVREPGERGGRRRRVGPLPHERHFAQLHAPLRLLRLGRVVKRWCL
mmetsp:Transcript_9737/g.28531  ORF Transcript_9737/g.28531 Transcript_9737/m.28531 type:complete len:206 (+) Transcript_9737:39-656(+)